MANNNPFLQPILKQNLGAAYTADEARRILNLLRSPDMATREAENILKSILGGQYTEQEAQQILKYMYPEGTQFDPLTQRPIPPTMPPPVKTFTIDEYGNPMPPLQSMPLLQGLLGSTFTTDEAEKILGLLTNGE